MPETRFPHRSFRGVPAAVIMPLSRVAVDCGRGAGSRPPRMRFSGATFASGPGLRTHPVQRKATKASIRVRAHESKSIEVLITPNQREVLSLEELPVFTINRNGVHARRITQCVGSTR